jgi:hypothetical protein
MYPPARNPSDFWRLLPAALASAIFHALLFAALFLMPRVTQAGAMLDPNASAPENNVVEAPPQDKDLPPEAKDPLQTADVDPSATDPTKDINYNNTRIADVSVPGLVDESQPIGIADGDKTKPPTNINAPPGFGGGQGGALDIKGAVGNSDAIGTPGGMGGLRGAALAGSFFGRSGSTRKQLLEEGGGTTESEAAVVRGLLWLKKNQAADGHWALDGAFKDRGQNNDIAGTAFGLLPFLGAGYTHKAAKNAKTNPYEKPIEKALLYLIRKQDKRTGFFGGGPHYAHALASIAICEAYGLSQDPALKVPAQRAINYLVTSQHSAGGWRYHPGEAGDLSVTGWVVMALKSAQMAGLEVPENTMRKAIYFLDSVNELADEGYGYTAKGSTYRLTSIGLLCREYLQFWGKNNQHMQKGVANHLKTRPPQAGMKDIYYYYYATQVMHHLGEPGWKAWNEPMRDLLVKSQDRGPGALEGSWSPVGDPFANTGGRLMITSLSILTLEVYYRHLPLYYRDAGEKRVAAK